MILDGRFKDITGIDEYKIQNTVLTKAIQTSRYL